MGHPAWTEAYPTLEVRRAHADEIQAAVAAWTRTRSKFEVEGVFQAHGVAACADAHPGRGGLQRAVPGPGLPAPERRRPPVVRHVPGLTTALGRQAGGQAVVDASSRTLAGLRIAEITNVLAGPLAGATLAAMGATSVRFEEPQRLDLYRRNGPFQSGVAGPGAGRLLPDRQLLQAQRQPAGGRAGVRGGGERVGRPGAGERGRGPPGAPGPGAAGGGGQDPDLHERFRPHRPRRRLQGLRQQRAGVRRDGRRGAGAVPTPRPWWARPSPTATSPCGRPPWRRRGGSAAPNRTGSTCPWPRWWPRNLNGSPLRRLERPVTGRRPGPHPAVRGWQRGRGHRVAPLRPRRWPRWDWTRSRCPSGSPTSKPPPISPQRPARPSRTSCRPWTQAGFAAYRSLGVAEVVRDAQLEGRGFVVRLPHPEVGVSPIFALPWKVAGTRRDGPDGWYRRSSLLGEDDDWFDEQLLKATTGN